MATRETHSGSSGSGAFPPTHWSIILTAREEDSVLRGQAHDFLCKRYWKPTYCYIRRCGYREEDAKDLVQDFFVDCLVRNAFAKANPARGRFRNFLLRSLQHFMANAYRAAHAQKRRPGEGFIALDDVPTGNFKSPPRESPEAIYHHAWSITLIERVLRRLKAECQGTGKQVHYEIFRHRIVLPTLEGTTPPALRELAARLNVTEKQASNYLLTARRACQRLMIDEIRNEVADENQVDMELHDLLRFIGDTRI